MPDSLNLLPYHGDLFLYPDFMDPSAADGLLSFLLRNVPWEQRPVKMFGKLIPQPRLTASFADPGVSYGYSGVELSSQSWPHQMLALKNKVQAVAGQEFNTSLVNQYRDGRDYMGWHRDNEGPLGKRPLIASVSVGAERTFQLRNYQTKADLISVTLPHGSLLLMGGDCQQHWEHRLPKKPGLGQPRVNITFRQVKR